MKVSTIKVKCRPWGHKFEVPFLSDFSYGQFIYSSQDGLNYRYLDGINNETWDFVRKQIRNSNERIKYEEEMIQFVLGYVADKDSTADYYQNKRIICPICGRKAWHVYRDTIVGFVELKEMTFERFGSLDDGAKGRKIQALFKSRR